MDSSEGISGEPERAGEVSAALSDKDRAEGPGRDAVRREAGPERGEQEARSGDVTFFGGISINVF